MFIEVKVSKLYKFLGLPRHEKWLYLNTAIWLLGVKAGLCILPFYRLCGWLNRNDDLNGRLADIQEILLIVQAIERISQLLAPLRMNCLPQALVGYKLLRQKKFDVKLKIGVMKNLGDHLVAHAWLEYQGEVILGNLQCLGQFAPFSSLRLVRS